MQTHMYLYIWTDAIKHTYLDFSSFSRDAHGLAEIPHRPFHVTQRRHWMTFSNEHLRVFRVAPLKNCSDRNWGQVPWVNGVWPQESEPSGITIMIFYICIYIYIYISVYLAISISKSKYIYLSICLYIYICLSISLSPYLSIYLSIYLPTYLYIYICIYIYIYWYIYNYIYIYVYISSFIYIYT